MKLFLSYTLRDNELSHEDLVKIKEKFSKNNFVYIDALQETTNQKQVEDNLKSSDKLIIIETSGIDNSPWVKKEISIAKQYRIPIERYRYKEILKEELS